MDTLARVQSSTILYVAESRGTGDGAGTGAAGAGWVVEAVVRLRDSAASYRDNVAAADRWLPPFGPQTRWQLPLSSSFPAP